MRLLTSFNWTIGTLLLIAAIAWPFAGKLYANARYSSAERTVDELIKAENRYFTLKNEYLRFNTLRTGKQSPFDQLSLNSSQSDEHEYRAFISEEDGLLVIQAFVSPAAIRNDFVPPAIYEARMSPEGQSTKQWKLKGKSAPGLGLF